MSEMRLFIPISKVDEERRLVYGVITQECTDKSGEIFDYASGKVAVQAWSDEIKDASGGKSLGNLRSMHESIAAGKFTDIVFDDENKLIEGAAKVVDEDEWNKVKEGVYTGFSIGGSYSKRWKDPENPTLWRFTPKLAEVSLVDNPCVPTATFEYIKADGSVEMRKFTPSHKEDSMDPKAIEAAREALAKGTATDEQKALVTTADAELLKAARDAEAKGEATDEQKALIAKADAKPELVKDGKPVKPKTAPVQKNVWLASDNSEHPSKREAEIHNLHIEKQAELAPALGEMDALLKAAIPAVDEDADAEGDDEPTKVAKAARREQKAADKAAADKAAADKAAADELAKQAAAKPAPVNKNASPKKLTKGLHQIGWLANLLSDLQCLQGSVEWEQMWEQDTTSELPGKFKALVAQMCEVLVALVNEETSELIAEGTDIDVDVMEMAAKMAPTHANALAKLIKSDKLKAELEKAGARHSKTDKDALMAVHKSAYDHAEAVDKCMKDMGVIAESDDDKSATKMSKVIEAMNAKSDEVLAVTKVAASQNEALLKAIPLIQSLQKTISDQNLRIDHLEKQPAAPKGNVRVVSKTQDSGGAGDGDAAAEFKAKLDKMSPEDRARELMKLALANPTAA